MDFNIDKRLLADCSLIQEHNHISFLLHANADVLWIILVPHTEVTEFYQLSSEQQLTLCNEINRVSSIINSNFKYDKLNVATIGNVVSQMHIHIVARRQDDPYWPGVVWGQPLHNRHDAAFISQIRQLLAVK